MMLLPCGLKCPTNYPIQVFVYLVAIFCLLQPGFGQTTEFSLWLQQVKTEAIERGIKQDVIDSALTGVQPIKRVLKRDKNQSEFKLTLDRYLNRVVTEKNIRLARTKNREHRLILKEVYKRYGVPPRVILAIWGIETRFGLVKAKVPLIPSIVTLAFDKRRSKYFRAQLFAVLEMLNEGYIDQKSLFGSWAGAMGQPQFMPSSYLAYAQDFDGDGRRDIWKSIPDILASIANYLARHGWVQNLMWGREVLTPTSYGKNFRSLSRRATRGCRAKTSELKTLTQWNMEGVRKLNGQALPNVQISGALVWPDGKQGRTFLTYKNYEAIMSYNCAHLYAITVGLFSDRMAIR